ncbi:MAG: nitrate transporter [Leptothrix sp. (in: Bacteria)]|nr:nitrate transporter [Leptothrix sp. (in: b-proteobacteria)]
MTDDPGSSTAPQMASADALPRPATAWVAGSDAPEKLEVRVGFMPLTDCASVVMASELGFDRLHGVKIVPTREASWAAVRDKLVGGGLELAQVLYGLVYGLHLGIGGPKRDMAVLMTLNQNGQGLTLSRRLAGRGIVDVEGLARQMAAAPRAYTFAQTFPTGTHAMWLYYWLASAGINPFSDARIVTVPPPQMVTSMGAGQVDGCSVGEPWNHRAILGGVGITAATSQDVWRGHPEKVLGCTGEFARSHPNTARAVTTAVLQASRWIDASRENRIRAAETLAGAAYIDTTVDAIAPRMLGHYQDGLGRAWDDPAAMKFHDGGAVNYPYLSDGMWFLTQHKRWGLLKDHPDYLAVARQINQTALYAQAAGALNVPLPAGDLRRSTLIDGVVWDASDPARYADGFAVHAPRLAAAA